MLIVKDVKVHDNNYFFFKQIVVQTPTGSREDRLSPWASYVVEPPKAEGTIYRWKFWNPPSTEVC